MITEIPDEIMNRIINEIKSELALKLLEDDRLATYTVEEVAVRLRISTQSVKNLPIESCDVLGSGKAIRYRKIDVEAHLENSKVKK